MDIQFFPFADGRRRDMHNETFLGDLFSVYVDLDEAGVRVLIGGDTWVRRIMYLGILVGPAIMLFRSC